MSPAASFETFAYRLSDGAHTTVHVARYDLSRVAIRVAVIEPEQQLEPYCQQQGVFGAINGGFFVHGGLPLGELWVAGQPVPSQPFADPWASKRAALWLDDQGARIDQRHLLPSTQPQEMLQAGPLLLRGGEHAFDPQQDEEGFSAASFQFDSDITAERHPRAALGLGEGLAWAVAVDGRTEQDSGMHLSELSQFLRELGAHAALNLDGGASVALVFDGTMRNHPRLANPTRPVPGARPQKTAVLFQPR